MNESRKKPLRGKQPGQTMDEGRRKPLRGKQPGQTMDEGGESRFAESNQGSLMNVISPLTCEWRCKPDSGFLYFTNNESYSYFAQFLA